MRKFLLIFSICYQFYLYGSTQTYYTSCTLISTDIENSSTYKCDYVAINSDHTYSVGNTDLTILFYELEPQTTYIYFSAPIHKVLPEKILHAQTALQEQALLTMFIVANMPHLMILKKPIVTLKVI
ncbi:MAG: hypothetical protein ORN85_02740 [Sediminibacterium sp.]|nr:hypothetical protein [Sediminibacterium sp.]